MPSSIDVMGAATDELLRAAREEQRIAERLERLREEPVSGGHAQEHRLAALEAKQTAALERIRSLQQLVSPPRRV